MLRLDIPGGLAGRWPGSAQPVMKGQGNCGVCFLGGGVRTEARDPVGSVSVEGQVTWLQLCGQNETGQEHWESGRGPCGRCERHS